MQLKDVRVTRRQLLLGGGIAAAAVWLDSFGVEPRFLTVTHHQVGEKKSNERPIRLVQLSDLHLHEFEKFEERIAKHVSDLRPDFVLVTGDAIDKRSSVGALMAFLRELPAPKIATLGNWEYWAGLDAVTMRAAYRGSFGRLLVNEATTDSLRGRAITFVGLDDFVAGKPNMKQALDASADYTNTILIQHCPGYRDRMPPLKDMPRFHFMLSGHTHGGQIAPFGWAPYTPRGSGHYVKGWYREDARVPMYVSRGIGTTIIPARFFSPPEIAVFDLFV